MTSPAHLDTALDAGKTTTKAKKPGFSGIPRKDLSWRRVEIDALDLAGLRAAIIGGTGGLGRSLALQLSSRGADVIVVGQTFRDPDVRGLRFVQADLSLMSDARRVGRELPAEQLDLVVFTTGIFAAPRREETVEGLERDLAVSYLSRLVLVRELAARLGRNRASSPWSKTLPRPRVFIMGFPGTNQTGTLDDLNAERGYDAMPVHMNTVAGNEALVLDAARRAPDVDFFGLNPGLVKTNIRANFLGQGSLKHRLAEFFIGLLMISATKYGKRTVPLLVAPELSGRAPAMFNQKGVAIEASAVMTPSHVGEYMRASEDLLARKIG
ncbi:MAG: SDR family NAD(P)-dependent oxidoreductase [Kofleriaceae bacterium]